MDIALKTGHVQVRIYPDTAKCVAEIYLHADYIPYAIQKEEITYHNIVVMEFLAFRFTRKGKVQISKSYRGYCPLNSKIDNCTKPEDLTAIAGISLLLKRS